MALNWKRWNKVDQSLTNEQIEDWKTMQYRIFKIPDEGGEAALEALNRFLRGHQVLQIERRHNESGGYWSFCVECRETGRTAEMPGGKSRSRVDYREKLSEEDLSVCCRIREWRNNLAKEENVPVPSSRMREEGLADASVLNGLPLRWSEAILKSSSLLLCSIRERVGGTERLSLSFMGLIIVYSVSRTGMDSVSPLQAGDCGMWMRRVHTEVSRKVVIAQARDVIKL
jgi:hypothetical protein